METTIAISVDKSHLTTIGEKLYGESLELMRELVSNAYDADATKVWIDIWADTISVKDNGSGMDHEGLKEYFNIGSQSKVSSKITRRYQRLKIGQFGIGKFAVLAACDRFRLLTQKDGFAAEVIFDKHDWKNNAQWSVPIQTMTYKEASGDGTTIILEKLKKKFAAAEVERFIRERLPLNAPDFEIYVNGRKIEPITVAGKRFLIDIHTDFGPIQGEIIAPNFRQKITHENIGIEITVHGIVIRKETFGTEALPTVAVYKLIGRIAADFLPITSDRGRFITDSLEYAIFLDAMKKELRKIGKELNEHVQLKARQKADETLKEAMSRLGRAIRKNPAFSPQIISSTGEIDQTAEHSNTLAPQTHDKDRENIEAFKIELEQGGHILPKEVIPIIQEGQEHQGVIEKVRKVKVKNLAGKMLVARRLRIGSLGIVCTIDSFGRYERAVFTEGGVISINQDHPLYQKQARLGKDTIGLYLAYLLSQQIALLAAEKDSYRAFEIQSKLLSDCF